MRESLFAGQLIIQGYLELEGVGTRYFEIDGHYLKHYPKQFPRNSSTMQASIDIRDIDSIKLNGRTIEIEEGVNFLRLTAKNVERARRWVDALKAAANQVDGEDRAKQLEEEDEIDEEEGEDMGGQSASAIMQRPQVGSRSNSLYRVKQGQAKLRTSLAKGQAGGSVGVQSVGVQSVGGSMVTQREEELQASRSRLSRELVNATLDGVMKQLFDLDAAATLAQQRAWTLCIDSPEGDHLVRVSGVGVCLELNEDLKAEQAVAHSANNTVIEGSVQIRGTGRGVYVEEVAGGCVSAGGVEKAEAIVESGISRGHTAAYKQALTAASSLFYSKASVLTRKPSANLFLGASTAMTRANSNSVAAAALLTGKASPSNSGAVAALALPNAQVPNARASPILKQYSTSTVVSTMAKAANSADDVTSRLKAYASAAMASSTMQKASEAVTEARAKAGTRWHITASVKAAIVQVATKVKGEKMVEEMLCMRTLRKLKTSKEISSEQQEILHAEVLANNREIIIEIITMLNHGDPACMREAAAELQEQDHLLDKLDGGSRRSMHRRKSIQDPQTKTARISLSAMVGDADEEEQHEQHEQGGGEQEHEHEQEEEEEEEEEEEQEEQEQEEQEEEEEEEEEQEEQEEEEQEEEKGRDAGDASDAKIDCRRVNFGTIRCRVHSCTFGQSVPSAGGPSVGLGWEIVEEPAAEEWTQHDNARIAEGRLDGYEFAEEGTMATAVRAAKLQKGGHRKLSIDLDAYRMAQLRILRRSSARSKCAAKVIDGEDPDVVEEWERDVKNTAVFGSRLHAWAEGARVKVRKKNGHVGKSGGGGGGYSRNPLLQRPGKANPLVQMRRTGN
jgi:hypothetical protein